MQRKVDIEKVAMAKQFSEKTLEEMLGNLTSSQKRIETLSHWCIFYLSNAVQIVAIWVNHLNSSEKVQKTPLLHLANDILQSSKRKGDEFITEFWKVLPSVFKDIIKNGNEDEKKAVYRLICIWEERKVFGSGSQSLKDAMLGEEPPLPLELWKKCSRSDRTDKRDKRHTRMKLSVGDTVEKIVSAFQLVDSDRTKEDEKMSKSKSAAHRVQKMAKEVDMAFKARDPSGKTLAKALDQEEKYTLKKCIDRLKAVEANRVALLCELREALHVQESHLESLRVQIQTAEAQAEAAANMRKRVDEQGKTSSVSAMAAELADKLVASSSSEDIMKSVLYRFAAEATSSSIPNVQLAHQNPPHPQAHHHSVPHLSSLQYYCQPPLPRGPPPPGSQRKIMRQMVSSPRHPLQMTQSQPPPQLPHRFSKQPPARPPNFRPCY